MNLVHDPAFRLVCSLIGGWLALSTAIVAVLRLIDSDKPLFASMESRLRSWWIMCGVFMAVSVVGPAATVVMFGAVSWFALRELFIASGFTSRDRNAVLAVSYGLLPVFYGLLLAHRADLALMTFPLAILLFTGLSVVSTSVDGTQKRTGSLNLSALIAIYGIGSVPALISSNWTAVNGGTHLLIFLAVVVQGSDCMQYLAGTFFGKTPLAAAISPKKTREGMYGGIVGGAALGAAMSFLTPFPLVADMMLGSAIAMAGLLGDLMLSAIKRDRGIKDFSNLIPGHGGMLDRVDSLTLAAPAFLIGARLLGG